MTLPDYFSKLLEWCKIELFLWNKRSNLLFKEGEVWWCSIGVSIGVEIFGKGNKFVRPVLIFKKLGPDSFLGIPLTTQQKKGTWYAPTILKGKTGNVLLAQLRVLDRRRLLDRIGTLGDINITEIKQAFLELYGS
jgi:mRNA interferase MazF